MALCLLLWVCREGGLVLSGLLLQCIALWCLCSRLVTPVVQAWELAAQQQQNQTSRVVDAFALASQLQQQSCAVVQLQQLLVPHTPAVAVECAFMALSHACVSMAACS